MAGFSSVDALADQIDYRGFQRTHLYAAENDKKGATFTLLSEIAYACKLPVAFFSADFSRLGEISDDPRAVIAGELARAAERAEGQREANGADSPPQSEEGR